MRKVISYLLKVTFRGFFTSPFPSKIDANMYAHGSKKGMTLLLLMVLDHQLRLKGSLTHYLQGKFLHHPNRGCCLGFLNLPSTVGCCLDVATSAASFLDDAGRWKNSSKTIRRSTWFFCFPEVCFLCDLCWSGKFVSPNETFTDHPFFWGGGSCLFFGGFQKIEAKFSTEVSSELRWIKLERIFLWSGEDVQTSFDITI